LYYNSKKVIKIISIKGNLPLRLNMIIISDSEIWSTVREHVWKVILWAAGVFKIKDKLCTFCIMG